jgi:hypothetical protein
MFCPTFADKADLIAPMVKNNRQMAVSEKLLSCLQTKFNIHK